ncbi:MAG: barstar family protein [Clostridia bacterium]
MEKIKVDFTGCKYLAELHKILKESLNFPDYYGENLDALWDLLDYYTDENITILIIKLGDYSLIGKNEAEYVKKLIKLFTQIEEKNTNIKFEYME